MGGYKERNLLEDQGVNGWVEGGKSSRRPRRRWMVTKKEIFRKTRA